VLLLSNCDVALLSLQKHWPLMTFVTFAAKSQPQLKKIWWEHFVRLTSMVMAIFPIQNWGRCWQR